MTSGKTSFGKKLATKLDFQFLDLDEIIEEDMKMSINSIFEEQGEAFFRQKELEVLTNLTDNNSLEDRVIALGGGTVCFNNVIEILKQNGILVYLELPLKNIIGRLKKDKESRPLVRDLNDEELLKTVSELFNKRESYYLQADFKLDAQLSKSKMKQAVKSFIESQK